MYAGRALTVRCSNVYVYIYMNKSCISAVRCSNVYVYMYVNKSYISHMYINIYDIYAGGAGSALLKRI
jgi:hypothetical protein